MKIRIIMNFKYKHTNITLIPKKEKPSFEIGLRRYFPNSQTLEEVKGFTLKNVDISHDYLSLQQNKFIFKEICTLKEVLK